jgi:hypothetical protein
MTEVITQPKPEISQFLIDRFMNLDILVEPTLRDLVIRARIIEGVVHVRMVTNEFPKADLPIVLEQIKGLLRKAETEDD